jgi:uncharacterized protein (DUF488 family)
MAVYTIGHSTRELNDFIDILKHYSVELLADVRSVPRSRYAPQFNDDALNKSLKKHGITYLHLPDLGGLRHPNKASVNTGWRNASFRGYADYMQTKEFKLGIGRLLELAEQKTVAIMCAEAVPWRCHRSLIGDALLIRNVKVIDIFDKSKTQNETLTDFAESSGTNISYPG